jgi:predicted transcriptional regulator
LPDPVRTLDFRRFRDAEITTPTKDNPTAAFDRAMELIRSADEYRGLTQNSLPEYMKTICDRVVSGQLDFQGVIEANFIEVLRTDPDRAARWHDIAHGMWLYDGHVPINMHIVDETALIWLCAEDESGEDVVIKGVLESEHPAVVSWAESLYEKYRDEGEPLDPEILPEA